MDDRTKLNPGKEPMDGCDRHGAQIAHVARIQCADRRCVSFDSVNRAILGIDSASAFVSANGARLKTGLSEPAPMQSAPDRNRSQRLWGRF